VAAEIREINGDEEDAQARAASVPISNALRGKKDIQLNWCCVA
jgi:hypothetical protein